METVFTPLRRNWIISHWCTVAHWLKNTDLEFRKAWLTFSHAFSSAAKGLECWGHFKPSSLGTKEEPAEKQLKNSIVAKTFLIKLGGVVFHTSLPVDFPSFVLFLTPTIKIICLNWNDVNRLVYNNQLKYFFVLYSVFETAWCFFIWLMPPKNHLNRRIFFEHLIPVEELSLFLFFEIRNTSVLWRFHTEKLRLGLRRAKINK